MNYKLKSQNGKVTFLLKTGKDLVRNQMAIASAEHIIDTGNIMDSDIDGFPINVDDQWWFEGEEVIQPNKKNHFKKTKTDVETEEEKEV